MAIPAIPITTALKTNLSPLTTIATTAASLAKLVLVSPKDTQGYQPVQRQMKDGVTPPLQPNFLFQYEGEQVIDIESDITDHYVEDNTPLADQIALRPETFKTSGFIGELTDLLPTYLKKISDAAYLLIDVSGYVPQLSVTAFVAYQQALLLYENAASIEQSAVNVWNSIPGNSPSNALPPASGNTSDSTTQNKQQSAFQYFYGYWFNRQLFNIQTPWAIFTDMAIQSLRAIQDEESRMITDFEITFKKIRVAISSTNTSLTQGRAFTQRAVVQQNGISGSQTTSGSGSLRNFLEPASPASIP